MNKSQNSIHKSSNCNLGREHYINCLVQDSRISIANALEIVQSDTKPSINAIQFSIVTIATNVIHLYASSFDLDKWNLATSTPPRSHMIISAILKNKV